MNADSDGVLRLIEQARQQGHPEFVEDLTVVSAVVMIVKGSEDPAAQVVRLHPDGRSRHLPGGSDAA